MARGDDDRLARHLRAGAGLDREELTVLVSGPRERLHLLSEHDLRAELEALLRAEIYKRLAADLRVAGDVVDVLLGIDRRDLAAQLLEALDDADRGLAMAAVVGRSEPDRPGS